MGFSKDKEISFKISDDVNELIEEKGNMIGMLRKVAWNGKDAHLEIRKWVVTNVDDEKAMKGYSFMTKEGPNNLINTMITKGYGDTTNILNSLKDRKDFDESLAKVISKNKIEKAKKKEVITDDEYYDPRKLLNIE